MRDLPIRHDVIVLETGMPVAVVRARLDRFDMTADPVVVVRKQNIASYSFHRISAHQLSERLGGAEPDAVIADLFDFDAGNQVDVHELAEIDDTPPYGIVAMGRTIVGFAEGSFESAIGEATRSAGAAVMDPPNLASPIEPMARRE